MMSHVNALDLVEVCRKRLELFRDNGQEIDGDDAQNMIELLEAVSVFLDTMIRARGMK